WELHIDFLEDHITGKLHKTMLGEEGQFFSLATILRHFIFSVGVVWFILLMVAVSMLSTELKCVFEGWLGAWAYLLAPALGIAMAFCYPRKLWKTSGRTLGNNQKQLSEELTLFQRGFPKC
ncbi:MAG: hypothetical protein ACPGQU_08640, partial [Candidatus Puniceispirillaceae bacterium]